MLKTHRMKVPLAVALTLLTVTGLVVLPLSVPPAYSEAMSSESPGFSTGTPEVLLGTNNVLTITQPVVNRGTGPASEAQVTGITLNSAASQSPGLFPLSLGNLSVGASALVDSSFSSVGLASGGKYLLVVSGTYKDGGATHGFTLNRFITVPTITVPPDPGEAGRRTIEGIDSDNDGLRDDIQRWIYRKHPNSERARGAFRQAAVDFQNTLTTVADKTTSIDSTRKFLRSRECVYYALGAYEPNASSASFDVSKATLDQLRTVVLNTKLRSDAYVLADKNFSGQVYRLLPAGGKRDACRFDVDNSSNQISANAAEQAEDQPACGKGTVIVFGNGMFNDRADAQDSLARLQQLVPETSLEESDPELVSYDLAYNHSEVWYRQLSEVALQKIGDEYSALWNWLANLEIAPDWFKETVLEINRVFITTINDGDLRAHVSTYRSHLQEGNRIVIVSHSQGNFYANSAYSLLQAEYGANIGNVQVATPATFNASGGPWATFRDDLVMHAVREARGALPANISASGIGLPPDGDLLGHNFIKAYLRVGESRAKIISDIVRVGSALPYPSASSQSGIITITLTWGNQPDVDLHVFEPMGGHVYYAARTGQSGFLDVDDVDGSGPEHYFVSCDKLQEGDYRVGVNYFAGRAPEVATVHFKAGSELAQKNVTLTSAVGSDGDDSPIIVGIVKVRKNDDGKYTFELSVP